MAPPVIPDTGDASTATYEQILGSLTGQGADLHALVDAAGKPGSESPWIRFVSPAGPQNSYHYRAWDTYYFGIDINAAAFSDWYRDWQVLENLANPLFSGRTGLMDAGRLWNAKLVVDQYLAWLSGNLTTVNQWVTSLDSSDSAFKGKAAYAIQVNLKRLAFTLDDLHGQITQDRAPSTPKGLTDAHLALGAFGKGMAYSWWEHNMFLLNTPRTVQEALMANIRDYMRASGLFVSQKDTGYYALDSYGKREDAESYIRSTLAAYNSRAKEGQTALPTGFPVLSGDLTTKGFWDGANAALSNFVRKDLEKLDEQARANLTPLATAYLRAGRSLADLKTNQPPTLGSPPPIPPDGGGPEGGGPEIPPPPVIEPPDGAGGGGPEVPPPPGAGGGGPEIPPPAGGGGPDLPGLGGPDGAGAGGPDGFGAGGPDGFGSDGGTQNRVEWPDGLGGAGGPDGLGADGGGNGSGGPLPFLPISRLTPQQRRQAGVNDQVPGLGGDGSGSGSDSGAGGDDGWAPPDPAKGLPDTRPTPGLDVPSGGELGTGRGSTPGAGPGLPAFGSAGGGLPGGGLPGSPDGLPAGAGSGGLGGAGDPAGFGDPAGLGGSAGLGGAAGDGAGDPFGPGSSQGWSDWSGGGGGQPGAEVNPGGGAPRDDRRGGMPFFPPMMGGLGGGQGGKKEEERERQTWLSEDEEVWGTKAGGGTGVIGRPDTDDIGADEPLAATHVHVRSAAPNGRKPDDKRRAGEQTAAAT